jgi:ribosomal protein S6--L-glutamate ligase
MSVARDQGHRPIFANILRCSLLVGDGKLAVYYDDRNISKLDVVIPRIGTNYTSYGLAIVRHFENMGVPVVNNSSSIQNSRDKYRCLQILSRKGISVPKTVLARTSDEAMVGIDLVGGPPCILKFIEGTQGVGVMLAESLEAAEAILETIWLLTGRELQIQEFIKESKGRDIRAFVVGDEVVAAMERVATSGFRSNIHRGASGNLLHLNDEQYEIAVRAAKALDLNLAGIDMIESDSGPMVIEANSSPGFEGLEEATDKDIAEIIIRFTVDYGKRHAL